MKKHSARTALGLLALTAAAAGTPAAAQGGPWYVGATQTLAHDDNIYRLPAGQKASSGTISITQLIGGLDLRPGRQRLSANARVGRHSYSAQPSLDFDGYGVDAAFDWDTAGPLSGRVTLAGDRRLGSYASFSTPTGVGRNLERTQAASALLRVGDATRSRLWFEAELAHDRQRSDVDFGAPRAYLGEPFVRGYDRDFRTDAASLGARHRLGGALVLGLGVRVTRGQEDYALRTLEPVPVALDDRFDRDDLDLIAVWTPGGASRLNLRLSYGRTDAEQQLVRRDRTGWTGRLRWDWAPTAKLATETQLGYETNARSVPGATATADEPVASLELRARYALGAKLGANASLRHASRRIDRGNDDGSDRVQGASVGLDWQVHRVVGLGCSVAHETRSTSSLSAGYDATTASCTLRAVLQ